jgi:hypothetical protein
MYLDPATAGDSEIVKGVEGFHAYLRHQRIHISTYNQLTSWVHNLYNLTRSLNVNTKFTSRTRKDVAQDPVTAQQQKYTDSYFQHDVYEHLSRVKVSKKFTDGSPTTRETLLRRKYAYCLSNDTHCRAADLQGLLTTTDSCLFRDKLGREVLPDSVRSKAVSCRVRFLSTKTAKGVLSKAVHYYEARSSVVTRQKEKSTFLAHVEYTALADVRRPQMWGYRCVLASCADDPDHCEHACSGDFVTCTNLLCEHNRMFVSLTLCARKQGSQAQVLAAAIGCPCTGKCGKYHPLSVDTLRHDREAPLAAAGIPAKYRSHALRGNSEVLTLRAAVHSRAIDSDEAMRRAHHSRETQERYYEREPHPSWVAAFNRLPEAVRSSITVEEAQRLGPVR